MVETVIRLLRVSKWFANDGADCITALRDVDCEVRSGEFVSIVGHNGSGKSTLLGVIAGDYSPDSGDVWVAGDERGPTPWRPATRRNRARVVGRVFQQPDRGSVGDLTVEENFRVADLHGIASPIRVRPRSERRELYQSALESIKLSGRLGSLARVLSGGERQMLAVELALVRQPVVLLLDEHTAALDQRNAAACMRTTAQRCKQAGVTVMHVTHNLPDALRYADRVLVMNSGAITADLAKEDVATLGLQELMRLCGYMELQ